MSSSPTVGEGKEGEHGTIFLGEEMTPSYPLTNLTTGKTMAEITLPKLLKSPFLVWGFSFRPFRKKLNAPRSGCTYRAEGFSGESGRAC